MGSVGSFGKVSNVVIATGTMSSGYQYITRVSWILIVGSVGSYQLRGSLLWGYDVLKGWNILMESGTIGWIPVASNVVI